MSVDEGYQRHANNRMVYAPETTHVIFSKRWEGLDVIIECDEFYPGGREKNKHESKKAEGIQGGKMLVNSYMVSIIFYRF